MNRLRFLIALAALALVCTASGGASGQPVPALQQISAAPQLAILDTDIGDDIDDAFALALALRSPELKLLGITTAFGDTELRARLVDRFLDEVGVHIPVAAGVATPAGNFTQAAYARRGLRFSAADPFKERKHVDAVGFLLEQIRLHPDQITLIAIGPLFNIQAAIERDPATFRELKRVVIMGGSVYRGYDSKTGTHTPPAAEWNIKCDPAGAKALLAAGVPVFVMPLDSTQIHLGQQEQGTIYSHGSPLTDQLTLLYHQWAGSRETATPTLFDPVAVTYAIRPDLCPMKPMRLEVDDNGFTRPVDGAPNAQVCLQSDEKGFLGLLLDRILKEPAR